ncbi:pseudaminic acid cytidylyltransferase [Salidesulfovibrio onnuriiensis]|uniref:pseudaminic acid cytidylyltransferase n=1 Tax=Salidesulfovibrio onnuriiensis TaxID=2583823 RepID=UPI0011CA9925|nr:pseudaminic acid cytidylyltransferase [Salidesulfovibrio onnuriiensis]
MSIALQNQGNVAIIPARGGSKRIPRKNIREFAGKPIIAHSIETALKSGLFESVVVSTDDEDIAEVAREYGAETPFLRPADLADDFTGIVSVIRHAVQQLQDDGRNVINVCCMFATAPFIVPADLAAGLEALKNAPAAFSVTSFAYPIFRSLRMEEDGRLEMFHPENLNARSQDLPQAWHDAGQFYWARKDFLLSGGEFLMGDAVGIVIPRHRVQDIDDEEDWVRAEAMYRVLRERNEI